MSNLFTQWFGNNNEGSVQLIDENNNNNNSNNNNNNRNIFIDSITSINTLLPINSNNSTENNEDSILKLSYFERISLFIVCILGCYACYSICFIFFPILSLKPTKFSLIWSIGSILFLISFIILNGPEKFFRNSISFERLPFTISFIGSISLTLIFSLIWKHNLLVIISCIIQAICSIYYTVSYFPYGREGLRLTTGVARNQVENWLSV